MSTRWLPLARATIVLGAALLAAAAPSAALIDERIHRHDGVRLEVTFNQPGFDGRASDQLEQRVINLISKAAPGSEVRLSIYTFTQEPIARALLEANRRDVVVHVIADHKSLRKRAAVLDLLRYGDADTPGLTGCEGPLRVCRFGCHGFLSNHNKFMLLSTLRDGSRSVVAQTSSNFTRGQRRHYNDLLVIKGHDALYDTYLDYFSDLERRRWSPRYYQRVHPGSDMVVHFFPRFFGKDPVEQVLKRVRCDDDSIIRVAHSRFDRFRSGVARRLRQLADQGCDVQVIVRNEPSQFSPGRPVVRKLDELVTILPYDEPGSQHNAIHTKLILIRAQLRGSEAPQHLVLTGSHNLSLTSLRLNDEVLLQIRDADLFDAYERFWESILSGDEAS